MALANLVKNRIIRFLIPNQRAVGFDDDAVLMAEVHDLWLLAEGMELDLIDMRRIDLRKALELLDMSNAPAAHTDTARLTILQQLLQSLIHLFPLLGSATRCVYQE